MNLRIIVSGSGSITAEVTETALLLGYEVINLNPRDKSLSVAGKIFTLQDVTEEFLDLPIIMSSTEYPEFAHLPLDRRWVENHKKLFRHSESIGFKNWASIVHPSAVISSSAKIGVNVFVNANTTISSNSIVSDNTQINRNVSIGHDVTIGNFCNITPGVTVTGFTSIQDSVFIGAGTIIINGVNVGSSATIAAGSVVTRNVQSSTIVMGSPARRKNNIYRSLRRTFMFRISKYLKSLGVEPLVRRLYERLKF